MNEVASSGCKDSLHAVLAQGLSDLVSAFSLPQEVLQLRLDEMLILPSSRGFSGPPRGRAEVTLDSIEDALEPEYRRERGAHMTPRAAAEAMVALLGDLPRGALGDISCGHGELLLALRRRFPERELIGVEWREELAIASALRLLRDDLQAAARGDHRSGRIRIHCGDGLQAEAPWIPRGGFAGLLGNPPYVPEKGRGDFFQGLQDAHPHLSACFAPRMDLLYLFLCRGAQLTKPGGWNVWLTPPYWLTATGAAAARQMLREAMSPREFLLLKEDRLFAAMPGEEHLISTSTRRKPGAMVEGFQVRRSSLSDLLEAEPRAGDLKTLSDAGWFPFASEAALKWKEAAELRGSRLGDLAQDFQGFVSGADRVTRRNQSLVPNEELGESIFLWEQGPLPARWEGAPRGLIRPVLRGRELSPDLVFRQCPGNSRVLYVDDEAFQSCGEEAMEALLGRFRPILECRREVRLGRMPWARLHWPRERRAMQGPKLVVPRRAPRPAFALDLSGAMVSSDCTFLVAPDGVKDPRRYLAGLMLLLNREETERYLRDFGKRKGAQLEFYSEPLRRTPLPARLEEGELRLEPKTFSQDEVRRFWDSVDALLAEGQEG